MALATPLPAPQAQALQAWYQALGKPLTGEDFGHLVGRAAYLQLGKPYHDAAWQPGPETLLCEINSFQCVSLVESSLAIARCAWQKTADSSCFLQQLQSLRYRDGKISNYASRLHYFEEWLLNNQQRGHVELRTEALGGTPILSAFFYMSMHPEHFGALKNREIQQSILATEHLLSQTPFFILPTKAVRTTQKYLHNGDIIAIVKKNLGLMIRHTGFVMQDPNGKVQLLHASSKHRQVILTELTEYIDKHPACRGIMVAKPLPP